MKGGLPMMKSAAGHALAFGRTGRCTSTRSVSSGTISPVMGWGLVRPPQRVTSAPCASFTGWVAV